MLSFRVLSSLRDSIHDVMISKEYEKARNRVLSDPEVISLCKTHPMLKIRLLPRLFRFKGRMIKNTSTIRDNSMNGYRRILEEQINNIDSVIDSFASDLDHQTSRAEKPALLCKYVTKEYASKCVFESAVRYSSVGYYR